MARLHPATLLRRFRGRRIGVVGDFMLDRFIRGSVACISPEAPVPLVRVAPGGEDARLGGAGNVVANLAALGARPLALGVVGADASGRLLRRKLHQVAGAKDALVVVRKRVTTVKTRIIVLHQHVTQVDPDSEVHTAVVGKLGVALGQPSLDFNGGIDRVYNAGKLSQDGVALGIYYAASVFLDFGGKYFSVSGQCFEGALLVVPHQARIAHHVRTENGGQFADCF